MPHACKTPKSDLPCLSSRSAIAPSDSFWSSTCSPAMRTQLARLSSSCQETSSIHVTWNGESRSTNVYQFHLREPIRERPRSPDLLFRDFEVHRTLNILPALRMVPRELQRSLPRHERIDIGTLPVESQTCPRTKQHERPSVDAIVVRVHIGVNRQLRTPHPPPARPSVHLLLVAALEYPLPQRPVFRRLEVPCVGKPLSVHKNVGHALSLIPYSSGANKSAYPSCPGSTP